MGIRVLNGPFSPTTGGLLVRVKVAPKARRTSVGEELADADGTAWLKVSVTAAPSDGAANEAVVALLAKEWRLPRRDLTVVAGATARRKTIRIGGEPAALARRLEAWRTARQDAAPGDRRQDQNRGE